MLDYRAWIVACVILLSAAGTYLLWIYRPKATYNARSLSAGAHPSDAASKPATKPLHVEGCREDFIVSPGELIEPRIVPEAPLAQWNSIYGKPSSRQKDGSYVWNLEEFSLSGAGGPPDPLRISINGQHIVETLDGVELGLDSFGRIFSKMQDKKVEIHERILKDDNHWTLIVTLDSACGRKYRSVYTRTLPRDPQTDRQINPPPSRADGQIMIESAPYRSDVFMNKVAYDYVMETAESTGNSSEGVPSEHE
jgi:hypothetical protein